MKITNVCGKQFEGDRIFLIETHGEEAFSMYKLLILINLLSINESKKYKFYLEQGKKLYFEEAIKDVIIWGKLGIDLTESRNEEYLIKLCDNYKLKLEGFKQTSLNDFIK